MPIFLAKLLGELSTKQSLQKRLKGTAITFVTCLFVLHPEKLSIGSKIKIYSTYIAHFNFLIFLLRSVSRSGSERLTRIRIRIRILALINGPILTFLMCVKAINTLELFLS
jgi:hypothetical protein